MGYNYWNGYHQQLIEDYYWAYTGGTTSGATRNRCITLLYPVFNIMAQRIMWNLGWGQDDDYEQEAVIRIVTHLMPRLEADKLQSALQYFYLSTRHYLINQSKKVVNRIHHYKALDNANVYSTYDADDKISKDDMNKIIINELDRKIKEQRVINKTTTIFLILMKEYLVENHFDPSGFKTYIMKRMNIKETTYSSLISRVHIGRRPFNENIIEK